MYLLFTKIALIAYILNPTTGSDISQADVIMKLPYSTIYEIMDEAISNL